MKPFSTLFIGALTLGLSPLQAFAVGFDGVDTFVNADTEVKVDLGNEAAAEANANVKTRTRTRADVSTATDASTGTSVDGSRDAKMNLRERLRARINLGSENEVQTPPQDDRMERRDYLKAKLRHEEAVQNYRNAREAFLEIRARFRVSKSAEEKKALEDRAEAFLRQTVETMVDRLNRVKTWVANHPRVSDAVEASVTAKIDAEIAALGNAITTLPEDATLEQIQSVAAAVRARFALYQETIREAVADIRVSRIRAALDTAEEMTVRLESAITSAKDTGIDTEAAVKLFAEAKADLVLAAQKYTAADFKAAQKLALDVLKDMREVMVHLKAGTKANATVNE